ncbi:MAG: pyrroline-5-carboxylate reductase, partial [Actinobacteria bacterium]|nr:pyrroline-5-carboxylate reductase [Actinomycetota bacterium]
MGHDTTVAVIGGGNMGAALVGGLLRGGVAPSDVIIVETLTSRRGELTAQFPGVQVVAEVPRVGAVIVAVKPADVHAACVAAKAAGATRLLSIAAGVTIASLEASSGSAMRVVRAMPNTPAV